MSTHHIIIICPMYNQQQVADISCQLVSLLGIGRGGGVDRFFERETLPRVFFLGGVLKWVMEKQEKTSRVEYRNNIHCVV